MKIHLLLLLTLIGINSAAAAVPPVEMELVKLSAHCYYVQGQAGVPSDNAGFISNAGVIVTDAGVIVIDALGTPALAALLLDKIRAVTDQPVVKIITTHYHADHILGLQVFKEQGAEIIAPHGASEYLDAPEARERLEERRGSLKPWIDEHTRMVAPDTVIKGQTEISVGGVDLVLSVLGPVHSEADLTVLVKTDKVLYSGDMIFEGRLPFLGGADTVRWLEVLDELAGMDVAHLVPGHGAASSDPAATIRLTRDYLAFLREQMGAAAQDFVPFAEAYEAADWSAYANLPAFDEANRRNAYQVYLAIERELLGQ